MMAVHPSIGIEKKRRSTFAILFYINRTKVRKDGTCQLLCKVSIDSDSAQIGTKITVDPKLWNPSTGRADGRSRNALEVNRGIDRLTENIKAHYKHIASTMGVVTAELVKNAVKGIGQKPVTLLTLFREHNDELYKRVGIDRVLETYKSYVNSYNHLAKFLHNQYQIEDIPLRNLDLKFYDAFDFFLRTDCSMMPKTVHEHLYRLKKITKRAVCQGTLRSDPYGKVHPELPKFKSRHLKLEELKKLMTQPVENPALQRVRDWFLFSTFTGLAYADLQRLSEENITQAVDGTWWIHIQRKKTGTDCLIPLLDVPLRIIEKYRHERKGNKIFNLSSRSQTLYLTRKLGEAYGIDLTFHKARHNFGTHITLAMGIPIETVSRMMGHKHITTTQIYAKVTDKKVDKDMQLARTRTRRNGIVLYEATANNN